jgi:hypothetical protein
MTKLILVLGLFTQSLAFAAKCPPGGDDPLIAKIMNANQVLKIGKPRGEPAGTSCTLQVFPSEQYASDPGVDVYPIRHTFTLEDMKFGGDTYYPYGCWHVDYPSSRVVLAEDPKMEMAVLYKFDPKTLQIENFTYKDPGMGKLTCEFDKN